MISYFRSTSLFLFYSLPLIVWSVHPLSSFTIGVGAAWVHGRSTLSLCRFRVYRFPLFFFGPEYTSNFSLLAREEEEEEGEEGNTRPWTRQDTGRPSTKFRWVSPPSEKWAARRCYLLALEIFTSSEHKYHRPRCCVPELVVASKFL